MSVTYGFYNSRDGDRRYDAFQMSSIFDGIIEDGIFQSIGDQFEVSPAELSDGNKMAVKVGPGRAWFNHTWTLNSAALPLEISPSEILTDRIDAVILEIDATEAVRKNTIRVLKGTPSHDAQKPELIKSAQVNQYPLAYIEVNSKSTEVRFADIENKIGSDDTPFVTGPLTVMSAEQFWNQWNDEWDIWLGTRFDEAQAANEAFDLWISQRKAAFNTIMAGHESDAEASKTAFNTWIADTKNSFNSTLDTIQSDAEDKRDDFATWIQQRQTMFTATMNGIIENAETSEAAFNTWIADTKSDWEDMMQSHNDDIESDRAAFQAWINTKKFDFNVLIDQYSTDAESSRDDFIDWILSQKGSFSSELQGIIDDGQDSKDAFDTWISNRQSAFNTALNGFETSAETRKDDFDSWATSAESSMNTWIQNRQNDFDDWFNDIKDIFDENVIGNLQNQIDDRLKKPEHLDRSSPSDSYYISASAGDDPGATIRSLRLGAIKTWILNDAPDPDLSDYATLSYVDDKIGDINSVLDSLNGEVV